MRTFTTLLLVLTAATAITAPSPNAIKSPNPLPAPMTGDCFYSCGCSSNVDPSKSATCCAAIGSTLNWQQFCPGTNHDHALAFVTCCGGADPRFGCQQRIGCPVPDENWQ